MLPIYEGTSQIQALMVMKDTMNSVMRNPQEFLKGMAQARWRSLSARDPLERRVAKLQVLSCSAQQHLIQRTATDKLKSLGGTPIPTWPKAFLQNWDPKRDFSFALLHAENLTQDPHQRGGGGAALGAGGAARGAPPLPGGLVGARRAPQPLPRGEDEHWGAPPGQARGVAAPGAPQPPP